MLIAMCNFGSWIPTTLLIAGIESDIWGELGDTCQPFLFSTLLAATLSSLILSIDPAWASTSKIKTTNTFIFIKQNFWQLQHSCQQIHEMLKMLDWTTVCVNTTSSKSHMLLVSIHHPKFYQTLQGYNHPARKKDGPFLSFGQKADMY